MGSSEKDQQLKEKGSETHDHASDASLWQSSRHVQKTYLPIKWHRAQEIDMISGLYICVCFRSIEYKRYSTAQNYRYKQGAKEQAIYKESGELT